MHSKIKVLFTLYMCVYCVYKYTRMHIFKKNMLRLYIYIWYNLYEYKYIHVNIFKIYAVCVCLNTCVYCAYLLCIYNVNKTFILDATSTFLSHRLYRNITIDIHIRVTIFLYFKMKQYVIWTITPSWVINMALLLFKLIIYNSKLLVSAMSSESVLYYEVKNRIFYHLKYKSLFITIKYMM